MVTHPSLLVVDDEPLYCEACRRIFCSQGFQVDESNDAGRGLNLAEQNDYAAVLLDVKMPTMDGIEFLQQLRRTKPDVPVILMTGFPSVPNAASAVRLRASDYVTKPFTPEEITQAVHKLLGVQRQEAAPGKAAAAWQANSAEIRFYANSWVQLGADGTCRAGALISESERRSLKEIQLPRIGEVVFQGLPLAAMVREGRPPASVPAPVSGVVVAVNAAVDQDPTLISAAPTAGSWIACLAPTGGEHELARCQFRRVLVVNADLVSAHWQLDQLAELGCQVRGIADYGALPSVLSKCEESLLVFDEASFGEAGPAMISRIKIAAPFLKILVVASPGSPFETAYRERRIFYYAVEPFADGEIVDILNAAFCPEATPARREPHEAFEPMRAIQITNRRGHRVVLLTPGGMLETSLGLGSCLRRKLLDARFPVETSLGNDPLVPADVLKAAKTADRVFVLEVQNIGRPPGCLIRGAKGEFDWASGDTAEKVVSLVVQPDADGKLTGIESTILEALAARISEELASA